MAKLKSTFKNMFLSLFIICLTVAVLLAQVNKMTEKPIAEARALKLQNAIAETVPAFDNDPVAEAYLIPDGRGDSLQVYPAKKGDEIVGYAMNSNAGGFGGEFQVMIGFDRKNRIVNYEVLHHAETPGLGSKMTQWFKDTTKQSQSIIGRDLSQGGLSVSKDGGSVDAITAATITSRAFLDAVNKAYAAYSGCKVDSTTGATAESHKETPIAEESATKTDHHATKTGEDRVESKEDVIPGNEEQRISEEQKITEEENNNE